MKLGPKALLPAAVLVGSLVASAALVVARPVPEAQEAAEHRPMVAVVAAAPSALRMLVRAQGTVEPRTENELVAEVGGRLVWVSPALESGSFFAAGEVLARIEAADYEIARRAGARRARTRAQPAQARAGEPRAEPRAPRGRRGERGRARPGREHRRDRRRQPARGGSRAAPGRARAGAHRAARALRGPRPRAKGRRGPARRARRAARERIRRGLHRGAPPDPERGGGLPGAAEHARRTPARRCV